MSFSTLEELVVCAVVVLLTLHPMNTIHLLTHEFPPRRGGAGVVAEQIALAAVAQDFRVRVSASRVGDSQHQPYELDSIPNRGTLGWSCRMKTIKFLKDNAGQWQDSIVHLVEPGPILACMYGQLVGILPKSKRLVLTLHGSEILRFAQWPHTRLLFQRLLGSVDIVHFLSNACRELFLRHFDAPDRQMQVIPGAARQFHGDPQPPVRQDAVKEKLVCLTVARVHPRKGQLACLEAMARLPEEVRNGLEYWIAGPVVNQRYQQKLEHFAQENHLHVQFLGEVADAELPALFCAADIFAMSSVGHRRSIEGFGLVYLEAAAHGLPIVAHRIGGVSEAVMDGVNATLCDPENRETLAVAIWDLVRDPQVRIRMGTAGQAFAKQFSWRRIAEGLYC